MFVFSGAESICKVLETSSTIDADHEVCHDLLSSEDRGMFHELNLSVWFCPNSP